MFSFETCAECLFLTYFQGSPNILHVWLPLCRFPDSYYYLFGSYHTSCLLSFMCRGELAVYFFCSLKSECLLHSSLSLRICMFRTYLFQDYHWWWRSFFTSGFTAVYLFAYCVRFFTSKLAITGVVSSFCNISGAL